MDARDEALLRGKVGTGNRQCAACGKVTMNIESLPLKSMPVPKGGHASQFRVVAGIMCTSCKEPVASAGLAEGE